MLDYVGNEWHLKCKQPSGEHLPELGLHLNLLVAAVILLRLVSGMFVDVHDQDLLGGADADDSGDLVCVGFGVFE